MAKQPQSLSPADKAYVEFVQMVELVDLRMVEGEFKMKAEALALDQSKWKFSYGCTAGEVRYNEESGRITAFIYAVAQAKESRSHILSAKGKYILYYKVSGPTDQATAEKFVQTVGPISVYPYFRSYFADVTSQGGVRIPPLPVMKGFKRSLKDWAGSGETPTVK